MNTNHIEAGSQANLMQVILNDDEGSQLNWQIIEFIVTEVTQNIGFYYIIEHQMSAQQVFDFFSNDLEPILNASIFTESDYRFCIAELEEILSLNSYIYS